MSGIFNYGPFYYDYFIEFKSIINELGANVA